MGKDDYQFFFPFRIRYSETDGQGIVFNAHYLTYFHTAVYEYFRALPFNYVDYVNQSGVDFHTVHVEVYFMALSRFDDEIETYMKTARIGSSSITFDIAIFPKNGEAVIVKGKMVWLHADQSTHKACPLPQRLIELIKTREGIV